MQCIIMENTLIKLTLHDETKKMAHDSQIVRAKENLKLSQVGLKSLLRLGLSDLNCMLTMVYKLKKIIGSNYFAAQFIKIISHYKKIGYNINVLQQTACLVVTPITFWQLYFPL